MKALFLTVARMSLTASFVILMVLAVRLLLCRAPKRFSYLLWAVVLVRLLCPFAPERPVNLSPAALPAATLEQFVEERFAPDAAVGLDLSRPVTALPQTTQPTGAEPSQARGVDVAAVLAAVWLCGGIGLAGYSVLSLRRLKRRLLTAIPDEKGIWLAEGIPTPFVLGLFRPKIYLPRQLPVAARPYVLAHERVHLRRGDHLIRPLAWLAVVIHWFNPLVWLAFHLAGKDMEMSCDEAVLRRMDGDIRADYAQTLLRLSSDGRHPRGRLAFGEGDPKRRIRNVMNYKKPAFWAVALAVVGVVVCGAVLLTDPAPRRSAPDLSDLSAELEFREQTTESGKTYLRFGGTVNGEKVWGTDAGSGAFWHPADEERPLGHLSMRYPPFDGGIKGYIDAYWTDENRTAVTVSTKAMAMFSSWYPTYYWRFTVELSGRGGQVTNMEALGPETDKPGSIHYLPEAISDEEAVKLARIAAKLILAAEDYDGSGAPDDPDGEYLAKISAEVAAQWEKTLGPYLPFGLSYEFNDPDLDGNGLSMWYSGKAVRAIVDTGRDMYIAEHIGDGFPEGAVALFTVYEDGKLVGLRVDGEEEEARLHNVHR